MVDGVVTSKTVWRIKMKVCNENPEVSTYRKPEIAKGL